MTKLTDVKKELVEVKRMQRFFEICEEEGIELSENHKAQIIFVGEFSSPKKNFLLISNYRKTHYLSKEILAKLIPYLDEMSNNTDENKMLLNRK